MNRLTSPTAQPSPTVSPFLEDKGVMTAEADKIITVEVVQPTFLDGKPAIVGSTHKISVRQWRALSRHFKFISGPDEHNPANF